MSQLAGGTRSRRLFSTCQEKSFRPGVAAVVMLLLFGWAAGSRAQTSSEQSRTVDCTDPQFAGAQACQTRLPENIQSPQANPTQPRSTIDASGQNIGRDVYLDSAGFPVKDQAEAAKAADRLDRLVREQPLTDFQRLAKESTGQSLPIFGRELFQKIPSTFAPVDQIVVSPSYVVGPGDQVVVRVWGHNTFNGRLTVDRAGDIYVPQVGAIHVAGLQYSELREHIQRDLTRAFRNFELSVNLGQLRSTQVFVLGEAVHPGSYTVSSLATAFNALLVSGGPTTNGSMRAVQVQRGGQTVAIVDVYDFILRGDKSKDISLQDGDVVFIPVAGPQVAIGGSVRRPAIYEVTSRTTVGELLTLAGGLSSTAAGSHVSLERISAGREREALRFSLDAAGMATRLADGDVLRIDSILATYKDTVTIRGNLANAGRFPWHAGMKLSDVIPDRESLLTNDYWKRRNQLGVSTPLFEPLDNAQLRNSSNRGQYNKSNQGGSSDSMRRQENASTDTTEGLRREQQQQRTPVDDPTLTQQERIEGARGAEAGVAGSNINGRTGGSELDRGSIADQQMEARRNTEDTRKRNEIRVPGPEIDWSYAVIERVDAKTLKSSLVPFQLGKLVLDHDSTQDLPLQPGDIITILSQSDVQVSQDERTKFVRLEGEFGSSGVYSVGPDETLADVVRRAGGFTGKAYLFGATFTRESARVMQQQRLDEYISSLSVQIERSSAERNLSTANAATNSGTLENERALIRQLREMRATGRVVLEFKPNSTGVESVPPVPLENGDVFRVPSRPMMVSVVGAVYGQNVFLYNPERRTRDYVALAGKPNRVADRKRAFIIRADGSVYSKETNGGLWSDHFDTATLNPGDTIVIPEKPIRPSLLRDVIDWSQVFSQFAIGAAAINVIR